MVEAESEMTATKLSPPRKESIDLSIGTGNSSSRADESSSASSSSSSSSLVEENERLRQEVHHLKSQMALLQKKMKKHKNKRQQFTAASRPGVVLELPVTLKAASASNLNCCSRLSKSETGVKDHRSVSTDDDQETIEPSSSIYLNAHKSAGGLHHRSLHQNQNQNQQPKHQTDNALLVRSSDASSPKTRKTDPTRSSNYDSFSKTRKTDPTTSNNDDHDSFSSTEGSFDGMCLEAQDLLNTPSSRTTVSTEGARGVVDGVTRDNSNTMDNAEEPFCQSISDRAGWLVGLLVLQSLSSFIIARNESLLQDHVVIVRYLTMLVGAGGNAGNQASVRGE
jgi:hypothetical protein